VNERSPELIPRLKEKAGEMTAEAASPPQSRLQVAPEVEHSAHGPARPWTATYRLQMNEHFTFRDVAAIAPYLAGLGISHVYFSPVLQATPGSTHGYDVVDPTRISSDLGGEEEYDRACVELQKHRLGQLIDIVPNHMAAAPQNLWLWDVLQNGPDSRYARFFDVRWRHEADGPPFIKIPFLEAPYEQLLPDVRFKVVLTPNGPQLTYGALSMPLSPTSEAHVGEDLGIIDEINSDPDRLDALLRRQHYRLVFWQEAAHEATYRRFFDINGLIGLRVEDEAVYRESHKLILRLVSEGRVHGLRIDHVDGLRDPCGYLDRLAAATPEALVVVEKILESDERLCENWPVEGTTGYDFTNAVNGLFVDPASEEALTRLYRDFTGEERDYETMLREKKRFALRELFAGDVSHLAELFEQACRGTERAWERDAIETALVELAAALPVYRTYVNPEREELDDSDREVIEETLADMRGEEQVDASLLDYIRDLLFLRRRGSAQTDFVLALQQLTGPAMAKGAEDTAFYCYNRLISLNEVGGNPGRFGVSTAQFHAHNAHNADQWPETLLTTSTHDTKRGEDVRLRIDAISEEPEEWRRLVEKWSHDNEKYRSGQWPDRNAEYLLYQTLAGSWPIGEERVVEYMGKAAREAKVYTSWRRPNEQYETALQGFIHGIFADSAFRQQCQEFAEQLASRAHVTSLAQTLLKLTSPGIPDIYQGSELWQLSLVDPDNRRPVDYEERMRLLEEAKHVGHAGVLEKMESGLPKLWLIWKTLLLRRDHPDLFTGTYQPINGSGAKRDCVVAFIRNEGLITVVPRLVSKLSDGWADTTLRLPAGRWHDVLSGTRLHGNTVRLGDLLREVPVSLLVRDGSS
jgi:(1->4)-alpha-D-glucan 1-alpha-D-glucosylmutase